MGSVDGRLLSSHWTPPFDGTEAGKLFGEYAAIGRQLGTDAWMFGKATTCEAFPDKFISRSDRHPHAGKIFVGNRDSSRLFITVDPDADILYTSATLRGDNIVTILGVNATDDYLAMLEEKGISYIVLSEPTSLHEAMEILHDKFGVKKISLQGGGIINGAMLAAGLIDELSLVVYPGIDGMMADPSIFECISAPGSRPAPGQSLEFISAEMRPYGIVWLRYKFHRK